jgi:CHAT domain-containing protein
MNDIRVHGRSDETATGQRDESASGTGVTVRLNAGEQPGAAATDSPVRPAAATAKVLVRVVHGHLAFASYPVLVGHYLGDSLNGTELVLDRRQSGRISRRRDLGLHPGPVGTYDVFLSPRDANPPGSVIVGLGEISELTSGVLERTIGRGLLALGDAMAERDGSPSAATALPASGAKPRGVSCVLVGSGEGVIAVHDVIRAILRALQHANRLLRERGFEQLEIIELVEQQANTAWHAVSKALERAEFKQRFALDGQVERRKGAQRRTGPDRDPSWWTPVTITAARDDRSEATDGDPSGTSDRRALKYVVIAGRARAEASLVAARRSFIDRYVSRIAQRRIETGPAAAARTLFELLWPNRLKEQSFDDRNIRLILDESSAALPWEMLDDRRPWLAEGDDQSDARRGPPVVRFGVLRQLLSQRFRENLPATGVRRRALVIGDPRGEASALRELPEAQHEAKVVQAALEAEGYEVTAMIGGKVKPEDVVSALFAEAWEIVHIAAHGVVRHRFPDDPSNEAKTGVVLGGSLVLDAEMLEQMPVSPDLFFVNCCLLGSIDPVVENDYLRADRPALAGSVATQLIRMGVRAVIAAGWEVNDEAAARFAQKIYEGLLAGKPFGEVVQDSRADVYDAYPADSTWGAYQCYGQPDYRLPSANAVEPPPRSLDFVSANEVVSEIERIAALGDVSGERDRVMGLAALSTIEQAIAERQWGNRAEIGSALGAAFAQLGEFGRAIDHYAAAALAEEATLPVRAIEQYLNLSARSAAARCADVAHAVREIRRSIAALESLTKACGKTLERLSLIGSGYKRLAQRTAGGERTKALARMERWYRSARELGQERRSSEIFYPWSQELAAKVVSALRRGENARLDLTEIRRSLRPVTAEDFWLRVLPADLTLLELVAKGNLTEKDQESVIADYLTVWRHTGSGREMSSIVEQIGFLIAMLDDPVLPEDGRRNAVLAALQAVRQRLERDTQQ